MASIQLSFALRTTSNVKTVHLIGSWDNYAGQLPLAKDSSKKGSWKGTFRFHSKALSAGSRYWYYYQLDGYSVSHDPTAEYTVEPTTGRKLNILDVPRESTTKVARESRRHSREIPTGRPAAEIKCPKPYRPGQTQHIVKQEYSQAALQALERLTLQEESEEEESEFEEDSDDDSDCSFGSVPSLSSSRSSRSSSSSRSSGCSSPASDASSCSCERYGITRKGQRVRLDCGGEVCGSSGGECSDEEEAERTRFAARRHGVVIR